jgi:hypothetical protein
VSFGSRTQLLTCSAAFAALYAVFRIIPFSQLIGSAGTLPLSNALALTYALLLGPWAGSLSVVLGTIISYFIGKTPVFFGLDFLTPLAAVLTMGLMIRRKRLWTIFAAFALTLIGFNLMPMTTPFIFVPALSMSFPLTWLHMAALAVLLVYILASKEPLKPESPTNSLVRKGAAVAFVGLLFQQLVGSFVLFELILGAYAGVIKATDWPAVWALSFFVYPTEWVVLTSLSVIIAVPVYRVIGRTYFSDGQVSRSVDNSR